MKSKNPFNPSFGDIPSINLNNLDDPQTFIDTQVINSMNNVAGSWWIYSPEECNYFGFRPDFAFDVRWFWIYFATASLLILPTVPI